MKQNIYDNDIFFDNYKLMRETGEGLNDSIEIPAMLSLLPDVRDKSILDLGCGMGDLCLKFKELGANIITGIDISEKMTSIAKEKSQIFENIFIETIPMEDFLYKENEYDIVVSSLALHYIKDINDIFNKVNRSLKESGYFIFSIEHPLVTCILNYNSKWVRDENGIKMFWKVDSYSDEGIRNNKWFVKDVIKYHRTISTIMNQLIENNFKILKILEPHANELDEVNRPELLEERKRPPFLLIKSLKFI
ncbi:MAG: class I SAM-dependent methyltransferase [Ignavibacteriae bacterium]|nr:MAG: class I SAM-dependent methyltransferase [Ignavibacteriota bacterium]